MDKDRSKPARAAVAGQVDRGVRRHLLGVPALPMHPEPHTYTWTALEAAAIEEYGESCFQVGAQASRAASGGVEQPNEQAAQRRAGGVGMWKPIETAPKDGADVLVFAHDNYSVAHWNGGEWRDIGDMGWGGMYGDDNEPTHWMPLPAPPMPPNVRANQGPTR